jgi:DNA-binding NarL/FixJ family response regulator
MGRQFKPLPPEPKNLSKEGKKLRRAREKYDEEIIKRELAIVEAHNSGIAFRPIAKITGLSTETVRRILRGK